MEIPVSAKTAILQSLSLDGPNYGIAIAHAIQARTGNAIRVLQGSLYPALAKLVKDGLVTTITHQGEESYSYKLTAEGKKVAKAQRAALQSLIYEGDSEG